MANRKPEAGKFDFAPKSIDWSDVSLAGKKSVNVKVFQWQPAKKGLKASKAITTFKATPETTNKVIRQARAAVKTSNAIGNSIGNESTCRDCTACSCG